MKYQPNRNYKSDDVVMTPPSLAKRLIEHFNPTGYGLEPCRGTGNIWSQLENADWCEITDGRDFYEYNKRVDYIFTNQPHGSQSAGRRDRSGDHRSAGVRS